VDAEHREKPEQSNPEPAPPARSHAGTYWLLSAFVFLLFYFLSIGPVAKVDLNFDISNKYPRAEKVLETIYTPLFVLLENYPAADRFFDWYLHVWRVLPPPK
jgi:hypothetical protein